MKYFILAGEASGDKQGALLCDAIHHVDPDATMQGWGGEEMEATGVKVTKHYRELAFMGFVEVVKHLPEIFRNFKKCKQEILSFKPDALILVDYPGFNLRMANWAFKNQIPVYYYISPQLWAWHTSRVHQIKEAVRRMYVILPFEKEFYSRYGINALYIGHPLAMQNALSNDHHALIKNQIALLPGSRKHEIELILPEMVRLAQMKPDLSFVVVAVAHIPVTVYDEIISQQPNIKIVQGDFQRIVKESEAAIVTSGTATLETALIGTPQVVVYKGNPFSYQIARRLIKVPFISLVNLIAGKKIIPELIQHECNAKNMLIHLTEILKPENYHAIKANYKSVAEQLTSGGGAPAAALDLFSDLVSHKS